MAALRQIEDDARQKVAAEIEAKRLGDETLVKAQGERQRADAEARQKAEEEIKRKPEADSKQLAEAEARLKADTALLAEKKAAEAAEVALRLLPADRQRVQLALTSLGFDTRGTDGSFGPRSREMIASWQKARNQAVTGFLTSMQQQTLLRPRRPCPG